MCFQTEKKDEKEKLISRANETQRNANKQVHVGIKINEKKSRIQLMFNEFEIL